jgi:hypothetical protein
MSAGQKRQTNEEFTTAIPGFCGIKHASSRGAADGLHAPHTREEGLRDARAEFARGLQVIARGESEKALGRLKLPLVRLDLRHGGLDPSHGQLDLRLFLSNQRHFRADQPQSQSAEQRGGLNQHEVRLEMSVVESDWRQFWSAAQVIRLNLAHVEVDASGFQSDVSEVQSGVSKVQSGVSKVRSATSQVESDELLAGLKEREVGLEVPEFRLNQPRVRFAVTKVGMKKPLVRLK